MKLLLTTLFFLYVAIGFYGYGSDCDIYLMLHSGQKMICEGIYSYSRSPGYFVVELIIGMLSLIGGHILVNSVSAFVAVASLYLFWGLIKGHFSSVQVYFIIAFIGLNPHFIIASSSSMDYIYSIFFCLLGIKLFCRGNGYLASVIFALAISCRLSNAPIIVVMYLYFLYKTKKSSIGATIFSGVMMCSFVLVLFIPSFTAAGNTLGFLSYTLGNWNFWEHLSRFVYKNIYLIGLAPFIVGVGMILFRENRRIELTSELIAGVSILIVQEIAFLKIPLEIGYLLPLLFVGLPIFVAASHPRRMEIVVLVLLLFWYGFVNNMDILDKKYNEARTEVISARVGLFFFPGVVIADMPKRVLAYEVAKKKSDFYFVK
jgi:hypothetical protein